MKTPDILTSLIKEVIKEAIGDIESDLDLGDASTSSELERKAKVREEFAAKKAAAKEELMKIASTLTREQKLRFNERRKDYSKLEQRPWKQVYIPKTGKHWLVWSGEEFSAAVEALEEKYKDLPPDPEIQLFLLIIENEKDYTSLEERKKKKRKKKSRKRRAAGYFYPMAGGWYGHEGGDAGADGGGGGE
jgi:molybdopterin converting factor small subunit